MSDSKPLLTLRAARIQLSEESISIDLSVHAGERLAILAPESAGKSRLMRVMAGLTPPESGEVIRQHATDCGLLFRVPELRFLCATPHEEVALTPAARGLKGEALSERVEESLQLAGVDARHWGRGWHLLSAAQRYRVGMAVVYALRPRLLLLDEPGNALSDDGENDLAKRLNGFCRAYGSATVVFTSRAARAGLFAERIERLPMQTPDI
ncbi:MAG: ATP-binding cassette domain-containing protein [Magnetococcus sp. YQC-9]